MTRRKRTTTKEREEIGRDRYLSQARWEEAYLLPLLPLLSFTINQSNNSNKRKQVILEVLRNLFNFWEKLGGCTWPAAPPPSEIPRKNLKV